MKPRLFIAWFYVGRAKWFNAWYRWRLQRLQRKVERLGGRLDRVSDNLNSARRWAQV